MGVTKIIINGQKYSLGGGGGMTFTTDDTLTMSEDNVLSVKMPVKGPITKEAYDKLSEEEKENVYIVEEDNPIINDVSQDIYSEQEIRIGTWLGKPLYRRAFNFITPNVEDTNTTILTLNKTITIRRLYGTVTKSNGAVLSLPYTENNGAQCLIYYSTSLSAIRVTISKGTDTVDITSCNATCIFEYTKTTD